MAKTIFITGASSGIGKAAAKLFAEKGWNVIATMRDTEKEKELSKTDKIRLLNLDVTDKEQVEKAIEETAKTQIVDVVLNNAGYGTVGPLEGATDDDVQKILNTNLLGVIRVTKAFIPHFIQNKKGLFITVTSVGGLVAYPFFAMYHATKWALEGWSESMFYELKRFGIGIKTVSPGATKTDFGGRSLVTFSSPEYDDIVKKYMDKFFGPDVQSKLASPESVAETIYEAATDEKDQLRYLSGDDAKETYERRLKVGTEKFRQEMDATYFG